MELGREWRPICALFVPNTADCSRLLDYAPHDPEIEFRFHDRRAEQELGFWGIPAGDFETIKSCLRRLGKAVVYDPQGGSYRIFEVWPDGSVVGREVQAEQIPPNP